MKKIFSILMFTLIFSIQLIIPNGNIVFAQGNSTVLIKSYDELNQTVLKHRYMIKDSQGNPLRFKTTGNDNYQVNPEGQYIYVSNELGNITITNFPSGEFIFSDVTENSNVTPYVKEQTVTIPETEGYYSLDFKYTKNVGHLTITLSAEDGKVLPDKVFSIKDGSNNKLLFNKKENIYEYSSNSTGSSELVTDVNGNILIANIPFGNYLIEQQQTNGDYVGGFKQTVTISEKGTKNIFAINKLAKEYGNVIVNAKNPNNEFVKDVSFEIIDSFGNRVPFDGSAYSPNSSIYSILIPESGKINLQGIPTGAYVAKQIVTPTPYLKADDVNFRIEANKLADITLMQRMSIGQLLITKLDEETSKPIQGYKFSVIDKNKNTVLKFMKTENGYIYNQNGTETVLETDQNGNIIAKNIPEMTVLIKEIEAVNGYLINQEQVEKNIIKDTEIKYVSKGQNLSLTLYALSKETKEAIKGVMADILDENNEILFSKTSNELGELKISELKKGKYKLQILSVPEGYSMFEDKLDFEVKENNEVIGLSDFAIEEAKIIASIGPNEENKSREGAKFVLFKDGNKYKEVETDSEGLAIFSNLGYGKYSIKQISTPIGYEISDKEFNIVINDSYVNSKEPLAFYDKTLDKTSSQEETEKTTVEQPVEKNIENNREEDNMDKTFIMIAGSVLVLLALGAFFIIKKTKKTVGKNKKLEEKKETQNKTNSIILDDEFEE